MQLPFLHYARIYFKKNYVFEGLFLKIILSHQKKMAVVVPIILTEVFHDIPPSSQENVEMTPQIR
jgi:hypothetical protein